MNVVVLGAGASFDSVKPALHGGSMEFAPPLTNDLFAPEWIQKVRGNDQSLPNLPRIASDYQTKRDALSLEDYLTCQGLKRAFSRLKIAFCSGTSSNQA